MTAWCELCEEQPVSRPHVVVAWLRDYTTGTWYDIIWLCQSCAVGAGWKEDPLPKDRQPELATFPQMAEWLQLSSC